MRLVKGLLKAIAVAIALVVLLGIGAYVSDPPYWQRLFTAPRGEPWRVEWYRPLERVPGNPRDDIETAPPTAIDPEALAQAERYAVETDSVAFLVWHDGALRHEYYGPGFGVDTRTDPASEHKTIVALLVGAAIADGYIESIDQPAADFLTEWTDAARKRITIGDLLTMSSGLKVISGLNPFGESMKLNLGFDIAPIVLGVPAAEPPGTSFEYANVNSQLLGLVLERATGKRYADYLSERLWRRLGADDAFVWLDHENGVARTYCCIQTNARGWIRIGLLFLNEGRVGDDQVIPADWIEAMTTPSALNPNYGYQVWMGSPPGTRRLYNSATSFGALHSEPFVVDDIVYLDGFGGQRVYVVPSHDLVIVRTGRTQFGWDDAILPNAILRGLNGGTAQ